MSKVLNLQNKDTETGELKNVGKIEIKNQTEEKAELYFYGDIVSDSWSSWWADEDKCPQDVSDFLKELENSQDIDIYINSGGGSVFGGIAIYSMLKRHKGKKTVHVDGLAASIASVIALAGDKVIIPKYANFMIHNPLCMLWNSYNAIDLRKIASTLDSCKESILNIYMENVKEGVTKEELSTLMDEEKWFTGESAAELFNIKVEDEFELVACSSEFLDKYKNTPKNLFEENKKSDENQKLDIEEIANKVLLHLQNQKEDDKKVENTIEKEKEDILKDLDLY
ncbi:head maturation protease, ClpP-related [Paraclostridium sordellii]|uniref:head maturation protease, ClpP-related n=1 Tax=Paraclostridium sordellii TaxID=1505 RepID=UPI0005DD8D5A|nr:head maturation protease, ClpP-related [Paeniclostridium sordellii]CEQ12706.1 putative Clp protease [[Clostridium] sordellii] [Paeniclostridium sordellii]CEQ26965.1 putative Clp protease [[Clostridium] sordellii] [Paeniclostridium sordellii]